MAKLFTEKLEKIHKDIFKDHHNALLKLVGKSHGVYALYSKNKLYYVGKASDLKKRIGEHLNDSHARKWTHFTAFLTSKSEDIKDIEAVLIIIADPDGNKKKPESSAKDMFNDLKAFLKEELEEKLKKYSGKKHISKKNKPKARKKQSTSNILENKFSTARPLSIRSKNKEYKASLLISGKIRYAGKLYDTPSGAAVAAIGGSRNGWDYWSVQNEDGNWVKLSTLR